MQIHGTRALVASTMLGTMVGLAVLAVPAGAATPTDWATYRGGPARTGVSSGSGPSHDPVAQWRAQAQGSIASEPAVVDGVMYVGSDDGTMYALDAMTGEDRWRFTIEDPIASSPAVAEGVVYFGSGSGTLYAVDAASGAERWSVAGARNSTTPAVVDGVVYSGSDDGSLLAIDAATGSRIWAALLGDDASRSPAVAEGVAYIGSADAVIHAVDTASGRERWTFQTDGGVISTPVVADGVVYDCAFAGDADQMYALDASTGTERWRFRTATGASVWPPVVDGRVVFTGSSDGRLYALDAATGTELWHFQTGDVVDSSPTLADGVVYVVSHDAHVYAVDAATGQEVWRLGIDAGAEKGPAVADGVAYLGTAFGSIYAIGTGTPGASPMAHPSADPSAGFASPARIVVPESPAEEAGAPAWEGSGPKLGDPSMGGAASVDPQGRIWVASSNDSVFWIFAPDGTYLESWGVPGADPGEFDFTRTDGTGFGDIAFEPNGSFYVADVGNHRIQRFDPDRAFIGAWGAFGGGDGAFVSPSSVAADGHGRVYVGDDMRGDVQVFTSDGTFIRAFGGADGTTAALWRVEVDPLSNDVFVSLDAAIARYDAEGQLIETIDPPFEYPVNHAFDAAGNLYIAGDLGSVDPDGPDSVVVLGPDRRLLRRIAVPGNQVNVTPDGSTLLVNYYDWDKVQAYPLRAPSASGGAETVGRPTRSGRAQNGTITYHTDGDIWAVDGDASHPRLLIGGAPEDIYPWFAPDGERFVFERRETGQPPRVMVAAADGTDIGPVADIPGEWPWSDWSADSVHFAVMWEIDGAPVIQILTVDGSEPPRTLDLGDVVPRSLVGYRPPDAQELVFSGFPTAGSTDVQLYGITADGTGLRIIGESPAAGDVFEEATFSPDGSSMAYWNWEANAAGVDGGYLHLRDLSTGADTVLSLDPAWPEAGFSPHFLPDGAWLVYESRSHDATGSSGQLVVAPLDGSIPARLIGGAYQAQQVGMVSPDGTKVVQHRDPGGTYLIDIASGTETKLTEDMPYPSWQRR